MPEFTASFILRQALQHRFGVLTVALLLTLASPPLVQRGGLFNFLLTVLVMLVLLSGLLAISDKKITFFLGLAVVVPSIVASWVAKITGNVGFEAASELLTIAFLLYLNVQILGFIIKADTVDTNIIFAAISFYLVIGFVCAFGFSTLELLSGNALRYPEALAHSRESMAFYYSFVTLTTLGYGDITPMSAAARSLATLEAVTGQLVTVVLIARLVGMATSQRNRTPASV